MKSWATARSEERGYCLSFLGHGEICERNLIGRTIDGPALEKLTKNKGQKKAINGCLCEANKRTESH